MRAHVAGALPESDCVQCRNTKCNRIHDERRAGHPVDNSSNEYTRVTRDMEMLDVSS